MKHMFTFNSRALWAALLLLIVGALVAGSWAWLYPRFSPQFSSQFPIEQANGQGQLATVLAARGPEFLRLPFLARPHAPDHAFAGQHAILPLDGHAPGARLATSNSVEPTSVSAMRQSIWLVQAMQPWQSRLYAANHADANAQGWLYSTASDAVWMTAALAGMFALLALGLVILLLDRRRLLLKAQLQQDAARRNEQQFLTIFNQAAVGIALTDADTGGWRMVNQAYCDIVGYSREELSARSFKDITYPQDLPQDMALVERMRSGKCRSFNLEKRMVHKDGGVIWVNLTVSPTSRSGDEPESYIAVIQDISKQHEAQDRLRHNEHLLRNIVDHLPVGLILISHDGAVEFVNQRFEQIFGYGQAQVPDMQHWWKLAYPDHAMRAQAQSEWDRSVRQAERGDGVIGMRERVIRHRDGRHRTVELAGALTQDGYLMTVEDITERKAAQQQVEYLAYYDLLTRLPNHHLLQEHLQRLLASTDAPAQWHAILLLDLDYFRLVNETRGREQGDLLLTQVADRLMSFALEKHVVARQGDDEFIIVFDGLGSGRDAAANRMEKLALQVLDLLRRPFTLGEVIYHSSASAGIVLFRGSDESVSELIKRADLAMHKAEEQGRNGFCFYDPDIQTEVQKRATLRADLRQAVDEEQFELYYQPQLQHGKVIGAEALLRWNHPHKGCCAPDAFIAEAEESGLIVDLGKWVLRESCRQLAAWQASVATMGLVMAVNVSPRQFLQPDFADDLLDCLDASGVDPSLLKLELTESLLLQNIADTKEKMQALKEHGLRFSLDDFGTGYSSLAYLGQLPFEELKIDGSFVRQVMVSFHDAAIVRAIIALGEELGLRVIAEGIETEAQHDFLQRNGCHAWQGYLFARPAPADAFVRQLKRGKTAALLKKH